MKRIVLALLLSAFVWSGYAQTGVNRTPKTKVIDALALLPAPDHNEYNRLMEDLVSTGNEGVDMLTEMFTSTNNVPVNYALAGWAAYVTQPGKESARTTYVKGILGALQKSSDPEIKAYYIRLLQQAGGEESVALLTDCIGDLKLTDPAIAALVAIGSPGAKNAIEEAVRGGSADPKVLAHAVGEAQIKGLENVMAGWLPSSDVALTKNVYFALAKTGTIAQLPILRQAAAKVKYGDDPTHATRSYIELAKRLATEGHKAEMGKEAEQLMKKAKNPDARIAAFDIYASVHGASSQPVVVKAMDDKDRVYRVGVLEIARPYANASLYDELLVKAGKVKGLAKADIVTFVGQSGKSNYTASVLPYIGSSDDELNVAAIWAAATLRGNGVPEALAGQLRSPAASEDVVDAAKNGLLTWKGNVNNIVAPVVEDAPDAGKVAALEILAARRATDKAPVVIDATQLADTVVAPAAYLALKSVVSEKDLPVLYAMLQSTEPEYVSDMQQAVLAALSTQPADRQQQAVKAQMAKAGNAKARYYVVLAGTGAPDALQMISDGFKAGNATDKELAIQGLLAWDGMEAVDYLYDIAQNEGSEEALDGFIAKVSESSLTRENKLLKLTDAMAVAKTAEQRRVIVEKAGALPTFQSLIFTGKYLDDPEAEVRNQAALAVMNITSGKKNYYGPVVNELLTKALGALDNPDADYQREAIRKHLDELPKEGGYVSIFNGKDLSGWKGLVENPYARRKMSASELAERQVKADEIMRRDWIVDDEAIVYVGKGFENICTAKDYGDFELYMDWKLYAEGNEADGGVYLRGTPQVQIWDTARRNVGAQVGSGGLYNNSRNKSTPDKVADNKLGEWNTFYIKMVGDRVTVILNGEKVVDNVMLENYWNRSEPIFPKEQIELQAHGTRIAYKNLYINELPAVEPFKLSAEEVAEGYDVLFDGTNMHQWIGNTQDYIAEEGTISLYPGNGHGGNLYTRQEYDDFVFRFEFMLTPGANNGLGIRTPTEGDAAYVGMELQILDDDAPIYATLEKYQYHGSVYGVIPAKRGALKPVGEWNYQEVQAKGDHIKIILNGQVIVDGNIREAAKNGTIDGLNHPGLFNKKGHIGFLGHGSEVKFRNIRVKRLK